MAYRTAYDAVMLGMMGDEIERNELCGDVNCHGLLRTIRILDRMKPGECEWFSAGSMVGLVSHADEECAIDFAENTHESQDPHAYLVYRLKRDRYWQVSCIWSLERQHNSLADVLISP